MLVKRELRRRAHQIVGPLLGMALTGYFAYNLVAGDRGFLAWVRLSRQLAAERTNLEQVRAERTALDLKVANLRPEHIDPDLLDERARAVLNLVAPDEVVILRPRSAP
jgi:cell division protein FtsB